MIKRHPRGLLPLILTNMFTRFAFYIIAANLLAFLSAKINFSWDELNMAYAIFYFLIFILTFFGGFIADKTRNYKGTILKGAVLMTLGALIIAIPTPAGSSWIFFGIVCPALFLIVFGNGLFRSNIYAVLGQMYDNQKYTKMRDSGFLLFNLFLSIAVLLAPGVAEGIRNYCITRKGFVYDFDLPQLCHDYIANGKNMDRYSQFEMLASTSGQGTMEISEFASQYLQVFSTGFSIVFMIAFIIMAISLLIFLRYEKKFPIPANLEADSFSMDPKLLRQRAYLFLALFGVLNLFSFASSQDGTILPIFVRDYVDYQKIPLSPNKLMLLFSIVVIPIILAIFTILRKKGREPSTLKKMAWGMGIAAIAFIIMAVGSIGLPGYSVLREMSGFSDEQRVGPVFLIIAFFIWSIANVLFAPLLNSFISQFARPKHQGIMQSVSLFASSLGNMLLFLSVMIYNHIPVWGSWLICAAICLISMIIMRPITRKMGRILIHSSHEMNLPENSSRPDDDSNIQ